MSEGEWIGPGRHLVTLLLSDVEGSTRLWQGPGPEMGPAMERVDRVINDVIAGHGGRRPLEHGEGDSAVAIFTRPSDGVAAAVELQNELARLGDANGADVRLRVALHAGEVDVHEDKRCSGIAFSRCARLRDIAHGGQILVSGTLYELIADDLPGDVEAIDHGTHHLRDLGRPERVFELRPIDGETEFPPLRSLGNSPNNLPTHLSGFVGRSDEIATARHLLGDTRLLTLTGSGGCGKTRLALQVAAEELRTYLDGVWWVDLGPLASDDLVANAVAASVGLQEVPFASFEDRLINTLRAQRVLLVIDNCEHVIGAAGELIMTLLHACPQVKVMATTREPFGIDGETAWRVPSMEVPERFIDASIASQADAVRLFVDRAARARPNFRLTNGNAEVVTDICRRLDGIPLAIELAAARTRVLSPMQIIEGLDDRFRLLAGGSRTAMARQQTLLASVEWSYKLLSAEEKALLCRLAVFAGTFSLDAAEEVCGADPGPQQIVLDALIGLVDKSLVQVEERERASRYRLLETIRQFANQKLLDTEDAAMVRDRHLSYSMTFAERAQRAMEEGPNSVEILSEIDLEYENIRTAMEWARSSDPESGMRIARSLWIYWASRGLWSEGSKLCELAGEAEGADPVRRSRSIAVAAALATTNLDGVRARSLGEQASLLAEKAGDEATTVEALYTKAASYFFTDPHSARSLLERAIELLADSHGTFWHMRSIYGLGVIAVTSGDLRSAQGWLSEALAMHRRANNRLTMFWVLYWYGAAASWAGDHERSDALMGEAIDICRELRNRPVETASTLVLCLTDVLRGNFDGAADHLERANAMLAEHPDPLIQAVATFNQGIFDYYRGSSTVRSAALEEARAFMEMGGTYWLVAQVLAVHSGISRSTGGTELARGLAEKSIAAAKKSPNAQSLGMAKRALAHVEEVTGNDDEAERLHYEALESLWQAGAVPFVLEHARERRRGRGPAGELRRGGPVVRRSRCRA